MGQPHRAFLRLEDFEGLSHVMPGYAAVFLGMGLRARVRIPPPSVDFGIPWDDVVINGFLWDGAGFATAVRSALLAFATICSGVSIFVWHA